MGNFAGQDYHLDHFCWESPHQIIDYYEAKQRRISMLENAVFL